MRAVDPDVLKRALVVHADASAPVTLASANSFVAQVNRRLGTALYRRYLGRMLAAWPALMSEFHAPQAGAEGILNSADAADLIKLFNSTLSAVLNEALGAAPDWYAEMDIGTLFTMNGRKVKDKMRSQWEYKPRSFQVDVKGNHLIMTVGDIRDRNDFKQDLSSHVHCDTRADKIIMWLDQAEEYFGIRFSARRALKKWLMWLRRA